MIKKENILKRLGDFLDTLFKEDTPEIVETPEVKAEIEETPPVKAQLEVGQPLPDGEYEIEGQLVSIKGGIIDAIKPKEEVVPPEEMKEETPETPETHMSSDDIKAVLQKEFNDKLEAQKTEFELKLKELTEASKVSGLIQAPVEKHEEPKNYTAKDIIIRNIEEKINSKN